MNNNWKILGLTVGCVLSSNVFASDLDYLKRGFNAFNQTESAENEKNNSYEKFDTKEISTRTTIDKDGRVICESTETGSHNGEKMTPRVRRWTGTVDDLKNNRLKEEKFPEETSKVACDKPCCKILVTTNKPDVVEPEKCTNKAQEVVKKACKESQGEVQSHIAYKAFQVFTKRVFDLAYNTLIDLRQKEVEGCFEPTENSNTIVDDFADVDDFINRAFSEFWGTGSNRAKKAKKVRCKNAPKMFKGFIEKVREIARQTMNEFGIRPEKSC